MTFTLTAIDSLRLPACRAVIRAKMKIDPYLTRAPVGGTLGSLRLPITQYPNLRIVSKLPGAELENSYK